MSLVVNIFDKHHIYLYKNPISVKTGGPNVAHRHRVLSAHSVSFGFFSILNTLKLTWQSVAAIFAHLGFIRL